MTIAVTMWYILFMNSRQLVWLINNIQGREARVLRMLLDLQEITFEQLKPIVEEMNNNDQQAGFLPAVPCPELP